MPGRTVHQTGKVLALVRHAKSSWAHEGLADRERPLTPRGRKAARRLGSHLQELGVRPDVVLCSPAVRARQTLDLLVPGLPEDVEVLVEEELYGAGEADVLRRLRLLPARVGAAMVVGHNPATQELAARLTPAGADRERVLDHFPTAALAILVLREGGWEQLGEGGADLVAFVMPRER